MSKNLSIVLFVLGLCLETAESECKMDHCISCSSDNESNQCYACSGAYYLWNNGCQACGKDCYVCQDGFGCHECRYNGEVGLCYTYGQLMSHNDNLIMGLSFGLGLGLSFLIIVIVVCRNRRHCRRCWRDCAARGRGGGGGGRGDRGGGGRGGGGRGGAAAAGGGGGGGQMGAFPSRSLSRIALKTGNWKPIDIGISQQACPICQYSIGNIFISCRHCFHLQCIKEWVKKNKTCPICRKAVQDKCNLICRLCHTNCKETNLQQNINLASLFGICTSCMEARQRQAHPAYLQ